MAASAKGTSASEQDTVEEDVTELKFPKEFETAMPLLTSEVAIALHKHKEANDAKEEPRDLSEVFLKTYNYTQRLSRFKNPDTVRAVRQLTESKEFHKFEVVQLCNLCPDSAEEAKSLIPSLDGKIEDDDLQTLLSEIVAKKSFQ